MTRTLMYTRAHRLAALHDELNAAGLPPLRCEGGYPDDPNGIGLEYPDGVQEAAVAAVVAAHNPAAVDAAEAARAQQFAQDVQTVKAFMAAPNGSATDAQRDAAFKAFVRVARRMFRELAD